ncbi:aspartyl-phosphate phosphatase Spo0E family protein [Neobacillus massiliamazoniensis]|uniref:Putative stage 0 sporulation regulatory protein n=1 Tax=Neobacillus massiliamazoniensis TaxID=1499688 RepID=A0A0U1NZ86_9BACI|nr:aspartyl-phosphate phosphatase Spo0E family protein [Neobacillus massiliamazoniensis]CRK83339.1 putative stage 0 sporulation regulatory protein [Neobacillus massiliamazoniensis]
MNNCFLEISLLKLINEKKKKLIKIAEKNGINSSSTVACSQELDSLLNEFRKLKTNNKINP